MLDLKIGRRFYLNRQKHPAPPLCYADFSLYTDGAECFAALYHAIQEAHTSVYIMFFIWRADTLGNSFIDLLCTKAKTGVAVHLLLDRIGSRGVLEQFSQQLTEAGVHFSYSQTSKFPFLFFTLNQRNHRKLVIIDGTTAFLGGFNIGNEYTGAGALGLWRDYHVKLVGQGANEIEKCFVKDWEKNVGMTLAKHSDTPSPTIANPGHTLHQIICTEAAYLLHTYLQLIHQAQKEICLGSPYFIPGLKVFRALQQAQRRGVALTILIPSREDHPLVKAAAMPYLRRLSRNGAKIYFYQAGFFHGKLVLIDRVSCLIGTANFDRRSMYINHEISCLIHDDTFTQTVLVSFLKDLSASQLMSYNTLKSKGWAGRCKEWLAFFVSPFL